MLGLRKGTSAQTKAVGADGLSPGGTTGAAETLSRQGQHDRQSKDHLNKHHSEVILPVPDARFVVWGRQRMTSTKN